MVFLISFRLVILRTYEAIKTSEKVIYKEDWAESLAFSLTIYTVRILARKIGRRMINASQKKKLSTTIRGETLS
jgi:hypothetical protein